MFGPARLLGDGWVCEMALGRLSCARIGDGDVVRAAVVGAAQMSPRRLQGPHFAIARRSAVLEDGSGRLNVVRGVDELRERRNVSSSTEETPQIGPNPSPGLQTTREDLGRSRCGSGMAGTHTDDIFLPKKD